MDDSQAQPQPQPAPQPQNPRQGYVPPSFATFEHNLGRRANPHVQTILTVLIVVAILLGYDRFFRERGGRDVYEPPIVAAAKRYRETLPDAYLGVAHAIRAGRLKTKREALDALIEHAKPLADAEDSAFAQAIDEKGRITNPVAAADLLERAGNALR